MNTDTIEGVYLLAGDVQTGPFTLDEVRESLRLGDCEMQTLAWWEGTPDWLPLNRLPGLLPASGPPPPPRRAVGPPPPPPQETFSDPTARYQDLSAFWGKIGSAFLVPLIGIIIFGEWLGLGVLATLFVFLGCYNAVLAFKASKGHRWRIAVACVGLLVNTFYALVALSLVLGTTSAPSADSASQTGASQGYRKETLTAWKAMDNALGEASRNAPDVDNLGRMVATLSRIQVAGVDPDLKAHLIKLYNIVVRSHRLGLNLETEARQIQENTQMGGFVLGAIFGAAAAERSNDPVNDSLRAGAVGGMFANEAGNAALRDLEAKYRPQATQLYDELGLLVAEQARLKQTLVARYGMGF